MTKRIKWIKRLKKQYHFRVSSQKAIDRNVRDYCLLQCCCARFNILLKLHVIVTVLIIALYRGRFYLRSARFSSLYREYRYIEDRYIGVLPISFTVTFARTENSHRHRNIIISRIGFISGFLYIFILVNY